MPRRSTLFRVNLISNDSGVSQRVYNENGTPTDASEDTIVSTTLRDTALGYIYSGSWARCWLEGGANTATLVQNALDTWVPDYDLVLIILNEPGFGGCGGGGTSQPGLVRDDARDAGAITTSNLLSGDPQLSIRPQLVGDAMASKTPKRKHSA